MEAPAIVKTNWLIDQAHSEIHFKVKYMMVSTVTGSFNQFEGMVRSDNDFLKNADIRFSARIDSISTNNQRRDEHLKSDEFFNAEVYPELCFRSKSFIKKTDCVYQLVGSLTIKDLTKDITLDVLYCGTAVDPYGQVKAGFEISGLINRKDFGLKWTVKTDAGDLVISDEVRLAMNIQLTKQ